ncbi:hypothetical protein J437_LFUL013895 [Ladona fulva]|uniref:Uncharacterized protein n=1 Tax=Ladona fulva TaxID=123851 RepID=A0A8K0KR31_LADFU|nr:hypothetical protein J437_LFUL013895 [Ladona fulva]
MTVAPSPHSHCCSKLVLLWLNCYHLLFHLPTQPVCHPCCWIHIWSALLQPHCVLGEMWPRLNDPFLYYHFLLVLKLVSFLVYLVFGNNHSGIK